MLFFLRRNFLAVFIYFHKKNSFHKSINYSFIDFFSQIILMYFFLVKILIISHISCILNRWNQVNSVNIKKNLILLFLSLDRRSKILKIKISAKSIERVKDSVNFLRWGRWQELPWKSHITNAFNSQTDDAFKQVNILKFRINIFFWNRKTYTSFHKGIAS